MASLTSNGITLTYTDTGGDGRAVVLIHGWPLSGASWEHQVPALTDAGYRVITYDRRGFGESDKPADGYDYDTLTADLAGLLDGLDVTDAVLVGFSMGGGEVVRYLGTTGGTRATAGVLAGAVPPFLLKTDDNPEGGLGEDDVAGMEEGARNDRAGFLDGFTTDFFSVDGELVVSDEEREKALALEEPARDEAVVGCIGAFGRTDFRADIAAISVPMLVVHGDGDAIVPFEVSGKRSAEALADATLVVVPGGPHGFNVSHAEQLNAALLEFLGR